jgi:hypothetical protein
MSIIQTVMKKAIALAPLYAGYPRLGSASPQPFLIPIL